MANEVLTVGSCFSGIGGIEIGLEWTGGFETTWQIENDEYASSVLAKHWPGVKRFTDIRDVVRPPAVDLICGGFPCQDVSLAGTRAGLEGKRSTLWSEMYRLVCEVKPRWILAENVPGLLSSDDGRFFGIILRDLARAGYDAEWGVLSAAGVGAPHLRKRIFILAHAGRERRQQIARSSYGDESPNEGWPTKKANESIGSCQGNSEKSLADSEISGRRKGNAISSGSCERKGEAWKRDRLADRRQDVADAISVRLAGRWPDSGDVGQVQEKRQGRIQQFTRRSEIECREWWQTEPSVGRMAHGVSCRVDRLRCLGNAVVPQVAKKIGEMILAYESNVINQ